MRCAQRPQSEACRQHLLYGLAPSLPQIRRQATPLACGELRQWPGHPATAGIDSACQHRLPRAWQSCSCRPTSCRPCLLSYAQCIRCTSGPIIALPPSPLPLLLPHACPHVLPAAPQSPGWDLFTAIPDGSHSIVLTQEAAVVYRKSDATTPYLSVAPRNPKPQANPHRERVVGPLHVRITLSMLGPAKPGRDCAPCPKALRELC